MDMRIVLQIVMILVVAPVAFGISAITTYSVTDSFDTTADSYADNAIDAIEANTATGFDLASLIPMVSAAIGLLAIIVTGFLYFGGRKK